jgi:MoaA/NifB/PqqE/SkfB family radical SAM enzyme
MSVLHSQPSRIFRGSPIYYEQIEGVAFGLNSIDFLSLNLPPICNYHCIFCFASGTSDNQSRLNDIRRNSLTYDEYTRIIQEARRLGVRHLEISGEGEPDLPIFRDYLRHIISEATENGIHTAVFVNGSWLDESLLDFLKSRDTSLAISIKYLDSEKYDRVVGIDGAYRRVRQNIDVACDVLGGFTEIDGIKIYRLAFNSTVFNDNLDDNHRLQQFCEEHEIFFHLSTLISHGKTEGVVIDPEAQAVLSRELSHNSIILANSSKRELGFPVCGTFYYGIGINYDGEVVFDAHANDTTGIIGNIREIRLIEAVKRQRKMRDSFYKEGSGSSYCPLRDPAYERFIDHYGKERF